MKAGYEDLYALAGGREPEWHDENGVPRFAPFAPDLSSDIYADEIALLRIGCQACGKVFLAAISCGQRKKINAHMMGLSFETLAETLARRAIHYGDPPQHGCAGDTMNCEDYAVVQFWDRTSNHFDWQRRPELEGPLPDSHALPAREEGA